MHCALLEKNFFSPQCVTLLLWQDTINHLDWQHWWVTLFTQCVMKDHVTRYCCYWDNSFGLNLNRVGAVVQIHSSLFAFPFCFHSSSALSLSLSLSLYKHSSDIYTVRGPGAWNPISVCGCICIASMHQNIVNFQKIYTVVWQIAFLISASLYQSLANN